MGFSGCSSTAQCAKYTDIATRLQVLCKILKACCRKIPLVQIIIPCRQWLWQINGGLLLLLLFGLRIPRSSANICCKDNQDAMAVKDPL